MPGGRPKKVIETITAEQANKLIRSGIKKGYICSRFNISRYQLKLLLELPTNNNNNLTNENLLNLD